MDNGFGDDDGLRQARSRRRFQTGLLIFLLLFFMDAKTPQETQGRSKRAALKSGEDKKTTQKTVGRLVSSLKDLEETPRGPYRLRDLSSITGDWRRPQGQPLRTVVPPMNAEGAPSKHRPDLRDEEVGSSETGAVPFKLSQMSAKLIPGEGGDVSTVQGILKLGRSVTRSGSDALFEGLFFHKYGHMSAVVGRSGEELKLVWNPVASAADSQVPTASATAAETTTKAAPASAPGAVAASNSDRLALGSNDIAAASTATPTRSGEDSAPVRTNTTVAAGGEGRTKAAAAVGEDRVEVDVEVDEPGGDTALAGEGGGGRGGAGKGNVEESRGDKGRRQRTLTGLASGSGEGAERNVWEPASSEQAAARAVTAADGDGAGVMEALLWSEAEGGRGDAGAEAGVGQDGADDRSWRPGDLPRHRATPRQQHGDAAAASAAAAVVTSRQQPALFRRHLHAGGDAAEVPPESAAAAAAAPVTALDATMTGEAKDDGVTPAAPAGQGVDGDKAGNGEGTGVLMREFPAWVLPKAAVVDEGQESGPLPSQWYNLRKEYREGCQFLLTLQTVDHEEEDGDGAGAAAEKVQLKADHMRGEMVGINCEFAVIVEFQMSDNVLRTAQSQSMSYSVALTMVCLLQMCLLCCRAGLMMAQRRYGRNFMVPRRFQPPKFDYHRPIPPELSAQAETAGGQPSEETRDIEAGNCFECAICYAAVDSALEDYMLTPCDHVFHQGCLTRWMDIKMECPTCRRELPPQLERPAS